MTQLQKVEERVFNARDKKFNQKSDWVFSDWLATKYMADLRSQWEKAVEKQEKETGVVIDYTFGDLLC